MRVLLDTNVILDAMLQRAPWHREADAILQAAAMGQVSCAATRAGPELSATLRDSSNYRTGELADLGDTVADRIAAV